MAKNQRSYTPEFKQQLVDLYNTGEDSYPQLERENSAVKVSRALNDSGIPCSLKRVQIHMARQGLRSVVVKSIIIIPIMGGS
ncbi:transposase [Blautia producta]|uniref:transposase n=1 Tax=Blautia producta TaxID=33035 RepID=UPI0031B60D6E